MTDRNFYDEWDSYDALVGYLNFINEDDHRGYDSSEWKDKLVEAASAFIKDLHAWSAEEDKAVELPKITINYPVGYDSSIASNIEYIKRNYGRGPGANGMRA